MILCSRAKCGCMASALLCGDGPHDEITQKNIDEFTKTESEEGNIVAWEDRKLVWAERCFSHEEEFKRLNPDYIPQKGGGRIDQKTQLKA